MSKIDELIEKYCPDGIPFKELEEVFLFANGKGHEKDIDSNGEFIVVNSKFISTNGQIKKYSKSQISPLYRNDILLVMSDLPNGKALGKTFIVDKDNLYSLNQRICSLSLKNANEASAKFYFYLLNRNYQFLRFDNGVDQTNLRKDNILKVSIPVPPLPIQEEIVAILDKFTSLEAELEAELEARRAQYEYYRNDLLSFEGKDVEWKALGDVGEFIRGKRFVRTDMIEVGFPCIHYGEMYTYYNIWATETKSFVNIALVPKLRVANKGDVVIVAAGETVEDIGRGTAWLGDTDVVIHDACFTYKSDLNPKYVAYFLRTKTFHDQIKRHISSGKISAINAKGLGSAKIPIPPLSEQERIVAILDKFDALVNDISSGLPAELQARRQQYEYYRSQLLTFKQRSTVSD